MWYQKDHRCQMCVFNPCVRDPKVCAKMKENRIYSHLHGEWRRVRAWIEYHFFLFPWPERVFILRTNFCYSFPLYEKWMATVFTGRVVPWMETQFPFCSPMEMICEIEHANLFFQREILYHSSFIIYLVCPSVSHSDHYSLFLLFFLSCKTKCCTCFGSPFQSVSISECSHSILIIIMIRRIKVSVLPKRHQGNREQQLTTHNSHPCTQK